MSDSLERSFKLPPEQEAIRAKCFHPSGTFVEFTKEEIEQSIPERFEKIARQYPNRIAINVKDQLLTYDELNMAANGVACAILDQHGEANKPVTILMEHGSSVLVAILGLLKAGKIYVPLDPSFPLARLSYILRDTQSDLILTDGKNLPLANQIARPECSVTNFEQIKHWVSSSSVGARVGPDALAYILYTSGSTGQPKGVVDNHRNVLHGTMKFTNGLHICAEDRWPLTHPCSSSASVRRIFPSLLNGASLFPFDVKEEGMEGLLKLLVREKITLFSTGRIRDVVRSLDANQGFDSLRLVSFGGEVVHSRDIELYRKVFPEHCLIGIWFSSTETGNVTQFLMDRNTQIPGDLVPVGYPAVDVEIILLDEASGPVANGEPGEIAVKSRYLSPGYWRRPELTKERFLLDPHDRQKRIYLTGDIGRIDANGCLFHLGRKDDQVKIRGHRVEIAETEAALYKLDSIQKAFVAVRENGAAEKVLVAYVVPAQRQPPTTTSLRTALAKTLPEYMIPSVFIMQEHLPLTVTGKVDRRALSDPGSSRPELETPFIAPRTSIETQLTEIWGNILCVDQIGVNDNFFDLGGHSLAAAQVISRINDAFNVNLSPQSIYVTPTVAELAITVMQGQAA